MAIRMTAADLPDREMGAIEMRGGYFCGERTRIPVKGVDITITRSSKEHREIVSGTYHDSGDVLFEGGERIRIFDLTRASAYTQKESSE